MIDRTTLLAKTTRCHICCQELFLDKIAFSVGSYLQ